MTEIPEIYLTILEEIAHRAVGVVDEPDQKSMMELARAIGELRGYVLAGGTERAP